MFRKLYLLIALAFAAVAAQGQTLNKFNEYFEVDTVKLDDDGIGTVKVYFNTDCDYVDGIQLQIYLPDGFTIEKNKRSGKYVVTFENGDDDDAVTYDHAADVRFHESADGDYYSMIGDSPTITYMLPGYHLLFTFKITAPDDFKGETEGHLKDLRIGGVMKDPVTRFAPDVNFIIKAAPDVTGIMESIMDGADEVIYDLRGNRVSRPLAPGVYIINGEKKLIKN